MLKFQSITTNQVLPDDEIKLLQTQRTLALDELQILDTEIAMAELKAGDLEIDDISWVQTISISKRRRRLLTKFLKSVSISLAPHKLLPNEILSQIFVLALHEYSIYLPVESRSISPLTFCHTCSRWRQVALNTPDIWTNITVRYEHALDTFHTIDIAHQWFARSHSSQPLSLTFGVWDWRVYRTNHAEVVRRFISHLVIPYGPRLGRLALYLTRADFFRFLLLADHYFPNLRYLQLTTDSSFTERLVLSEETNFVPINAPNLEELRLEQVSDTDVKLLHLLHDLPWCKLTCFHLSTTSRRSVSVQQILYALSHCPRLRECKITAHSAFRDDIDIAPTKALRIRFPHLTRLTFASFQQSLLEPFMDPLTLPSLKELTIQCLSSEHPWMWPHPVFTNLYQRSHFSLELLHLQDITVDTNDLWDLVLFLHRSLTTLHLGMTNVITDTMLKWMLEDRLLPHLLCLVGKIEPGSLLPLIEVLERRCRGHETENSAPSHGVVEDIRLMDTPGAMSRPQFIMVEYEGNICHEEAVRIDRLREQGIRFDVSRWVDE